MPKPELPLLSGYLESLAAVEDRGDAREESFYPTLVRLLNRWAERAGVRDLHVTTIPRKAEGCSLDFQVWRGRDRLVGYIEAKRPSADLDLVEGSKQVRRYRKTFPNLVLTNFREVRLYRRDVRIGRVVLAGSWPARLPLGEREMARRGAELAALLKRFCGFERPQRLGAAALARALAERARFLRDRIGDLLERDESREEPSELTGFYRTLATHLFSRLDEREFANLYAQTVAYGLLAARCREDGELDRRTLYERIPPASGILRDVFRYISLSPPPEIEWIVDDLVDLLRPAGWKLALQRHFQQKGDQDPILHFYETFLREYDPDLRTRRGVFYTPPAVVSYVVRSLDHLLRTRLDRSDGLADPRVWLLDPAAGTMTFVVEAFRCAMEGWREAYGKAGVPALVRDHLLPRSFGFELMMAPYAIGHLKMSLFLAEQGYELGEGDRVNLLLTNALEREDLKQEVIPGMPSLAREVRKAAEVKEDPRICVVLGNPPWSGHSENPVERKKRKDDPVRAYYQVDGEPLREKNAKWLQDDYVKFLRFAQRKIDDTGEGGEGVIGLVLNHGYLDNPTFRGLRRSLMDSFDEIYVLDLHGNRRKREVTPAGARDENVFDIEQGVSILLAVRKIDPVPPLPSPLPRAGGEGARCRIFRADLRGNRAGKLRWLLGRDVESTSWTELQPRGPGYLFVERDTRLEELYVRGIPLPEIFPEHSVGVLTARDAYVMDFDLPELRKRIIKLRKGLLPREVVPDGYPRDTGSWKLTEAVRRAGEDAQWETRFTEILFRPFDLRHVFYADYLVERPRERVMGHLLRGSNLALVLPRQSKDGPGALITERIAAHKAVSAYDINYVFPLWLLPEGIFPARVPNLSPEVLRFLERSLGSAPGPEAILGYVYAVLYSHRYRDRYAAFLASDFPRILFPRDRYLFDAMAGLGAELIDLHLPGRPLRATTRFLGEGSGRLGRSRKVLRNYREDERRVYVNEDGLCFDGIPLQVWEYRIGGYQVLDRWLQDRAGRKLTAGEIQSFCRTATALKRTVEVQKRIDELYAAVEEALTPRPPLPVHPSTPSPGEGETC